ncbi:MAG TPA: type II secretion system F family protein [archaeon]|nr:type II secretion system F family protein [archaeon]
MKVPYKIKGPELKKDHLILVISVVVSLMLIFISILTGSVPLIANMLFLGMLLMIMPYSLYKFFLLKRIRAYEREFPNFLRDLAESQRAGLSLIQALQAVSKSDYGPLTKEVKKINNQLSWNVSLEKVLKSFGDRVSESRLITRSILIINQANKSGGNVEDSMEALADNMESIKEAQQEKAVLLNQQVVMMYAIFFVFLGITIALIKFLIPLLQTQAQSGGFGVQGFNSNPCSVCTTSSDPACVGCNVFYSVAVAFDLGKAGEEAAYYKALFLSMILVQGFFSGLIAGQIGADSVVVGIKHSLIMLLSGFIIFILVVKTGIV